jgi:5'-nucleotidase
VPSIAVSFAGRDFHSDDSLIMQQVETLTSLLRHLTSLPHFPADTMLNVNLPALPPDQIKGAKLTRLGRRVFSDSLTPMKDPWGREIFWIGGGSVAWSGSEDSDFRAVKDGFISITPLHLDLTSRDRLLDAASWWRPL